MEEEVFQAEEQLNIYLGFLHDYKEVLDQILFFENHGATAKQQNVLNDKLGVFEDRRIELNRSVPNNIKCLKQLLEQKYQIEKLKANLESLIFEVYGKKGKVDDFYEGPFITFDPDENLQNKKQEKREEFFANSTIYLNYYFNNLLIESCEKIFETAKISFGRYLESKETNVKEKEKCLIKNAPNIVTASEDEIKMMSEYIKRKEKEFSETIKQIERLKNKSNNEKLEELTNHMEKMRIEDADLQVIKEMVSIWSSRLKAQQKGQRSFMDKALWNMTDLKFNIYIPNLSKPKNFVYITTDEINHVKFVAEMQGYDNDKDLEFLFNRADDSKIFEELGF